MINSRAALLSLIIILVIFSLFSLINHFSKSRKLLLIIIPTIISFAFSNSLVPEDNLNTTERLASINFSNESSSQRFFLWENAFDYIKSNPFIGCGIGNWKVESAAYWGSYGNKYLVPFHAHNDFIEFTTELGVIGGFTYLLLFTLILFSNLIRYIKTKDIKILVLMLSFLALFVDSSLNFPFERPVIQVMFIILLAFNIKYYRNEPKQA
jgi:O-antigen ligase